VCVYGRAGAGFAGSSSSSSCSFSSSSHESIESRGTKTRPQTAAHRPHLPSLQRALQEAATAQRGQPRPHPRSEPDPHSAFLCGNLLTSLPSIGHESGRPPECAVPDKSPDLRRSTTCAPLSIRPSPPDLRRARQSPDLRRGSTSAPLSRKDPHPPRNSWSPAPRTTVAERSPRPRQASPPLPTCICATHTMVPDPGGLRDRHQCRESGREMCRRRQHPILVVHAKPPRLRLGMDVFFSMIYSYFSFYEFACSPCQGKEPRMNTSGRNPRPRGRPAGIARSRDGCSRSHTGPCP
jgi:hypothetical protein